MSLVFQRSQVFISFTIDTKGKVIKVELNELTNLNVTELELKQAFATIAKMPLWEPAMKRGRVVKSRHLIKNK